MICNSCEKKLNLSVNTHIRLMDNQGEHWFCKKSCVNAWSYGDEPKALDKDQVKTAVKALFGVAFEIDCLNIQKAKTELLDTITFMESKAE